MSEHHAHTQHQAETPPVPGPTPPEPAPEPAPEPVPGPPGENLEFERLPHETDAEFLARTRNQVPASQSPTDVVPNRPNISLGPQEAPAPPAEEPKAS